MVTRPACSPASGCGHRASPLTTRRKRLTLPPLRYHPRERQHNNAACRVFPPDPLPRHPVVPRRRCRVLAWISLRNAGWCGRVSCLLCHAARLASENAAEPVLAHWQHPLTASRSPSGSTVSSASWTVLPCDLPPALRPAQTHAVVHGVTPYGLCLGRVSAFSCMYRRHSRPALRFCCATAVCVQCQ